MEQTEIKSAEEFLRGFTTGKNTETPREYIAAAMVEFAKMHKNMALEKARISVRMVEDRSYWSGQVWDDGPLPLIVEAKSILECYPDELIK